jgi:hypothetical protein
MSKEMDHRQTGKDNHGRVPLDSKYVKMPIGVKNQACSDINEETDPSIISPYAIKDFNSTSFLLQ